MTSMQEHEDLTNDAEILLQSLIKSEEEQINLRFQNLQMEKRIKDLE
jgi:hypothetical protein